MKKPKESRKTRYTRTVLKDSLIGLMKEKPISKITIKELCENADINRTTFYAHYSDQYDLLQNIEEETLTWCKDIIKDLSDKPNKTVMIHNLESIFNYISDNRNHVQVLMSEQGDINFQKNLITLIYEQLGMLPKPDKENNLVTKELYFIFAIYGSIGLIQHWLKNGLNKSAREMAEIIYNMTFQI
mgnify:CR=1 FL=1